MMMSELSGDLETEILCRVPATSLKRLRSTCKRWNRLFSDSGFTRKHLEKAAKQFLVLMLKDGRVCSMSVNLHGMIPSVEVRGELSLIEPFFEDEQLKISGAFHCDGLLLCTDQAESIIVVWNPCTGQTRWIKPRNGGRTSECYALGSYQDNKSGNKSYKILGYGDEQEFEIYELNSNSWRILDVTPNCDIVGSEWGASLKGKTYRFGSDEKEQQLGMFLVSFDYTTEKFERLTYNQKFTIGMDDEAVLSVVREEKLSVLVKPENSSRAEIWLTSKIDDETKAVSWTKVLALDLSQISCNGSFLLDEEKKVLVFCDNYDRKNVVYIVGEDNIVTNLDFGGGLGWPFLFDYVPSLTQIQPGVGIGAKRKRGEYIRIFSSS